MSRTLIRSADNPCTGDSLEIAATVVASGQSLAWATDPSGSEVAVPAGQTPLGLLAALAGLAPASQSAFVRWTQYEYTNRALTATRDYHTIPTSGTGTEGTNFDTTTYAFDGLGRANRVQSPGGTITRTVYDDRGLIVSSWAGTHDTDATDADPTGNGAVGNDMVCVTAYEYNQGGLLTQTTEYVDENSAHDRITRYGYDARDRLQWVYARDGANLQTATGTYTYATYDNLNRVTTLDRLLDDDRDFDTAGPEPFQSGVYAEDEILGRATTAYDALGQVYRTTRYAIEEQNPSGTTYIRPTDSLSANVWYDIAGNVIKSQPGGTQTFIKIEYDTLNRPTVQYVGYDADEDTYAEIYDATSNLVRIDGDTILAQTVSSYDAADNLLRLTTYQRKNGAAGTGELDSTTARVTFADWWYDGVGRTIAAADWGTHAGSEPSRPATPPARSDTVLVTSTEYNARGEAYKTIDPAGRQHRATYDHAGRLTQTIANYVTGSYDSDYPDQDIVTAFQYTADSQLWKQTDTLGNMSERVYDGWGRLYQYKAPDPDPNASGDQPVTEYGYNYLGQVVTMTDPLGQDTSFEYDNLGRQIEKILPTPGVGQVAPSTSTRYDARGNVKTITDALDHVTTYAFDRWNRLETQTDASQHDTSYTYYDSGKLHTLTDAESNTTTWTYDELDRMLTETNELGDARQYTYDGGLLLRMVDRNDRATDYGYDRFGRRTDEYWYASEAAAQADTARTAAAYEINHTLDRLGRLMGATDDGDSYTYSYTLDDLGRSTAVSQTFAGLTPTISFAQTFDGNSRRTQLAATIGATADFVEDAQFDNLGRLKQLVQHSAVGQSNVAAKHVDFTYTKNSQFDLITRYAATNETEQVAASDYGYDNLGRLTSLAYTLANNTDAPSYTWTWDEGNRITGFTSWLDSADGITAASVAYHYDATGQLATTLAGSAAVYTNWQNSPGTEDLSYDDNGNRTDTGYTVAASGNNQMATGAGYTYQYDDEGNRTLRWVDSGGGQLGTGDTDITKYTWDHRNRLTKVETFSTHAKYAAQTPDQVVEYSYDYANRWLGEKVTTIGQTTTVVQRRFVYDGNQIALEFEKTGTGDLAASDLKHRNMWGAAVDQLLVRENVSGTSTAGDVLWALVDNLNTVRDLATYDSGTDTTTIADHRVYDSFGKLTHQTNSAVDCIFGYTGRPYSEATDLQNNLNRWYEAVTHRWLSEDPIGFAAGDGNLARYVRNRPTGMTDPDGMMELPQSLRSPPIPGSFTESYANIIPPDPLAGLPTSTVMYSADDLRYGRWKEEDAWTALRSMPDPRDYRTKKDWVDAFGRCFDELPLMMRLAFRESGLAKDFVDEAGLHFSGQNADAVRKRIAERDARYAARRAEERAANAKWRAFQASRGDGDIVGYGGYPGGYCNPFNLRRWAYTSYPDCSDEYYHSCMTECGERLSTMGVGVSVNANAAISTPVGGFSTGGPNVSLVFHFGTGDLSAYGGWTVPSFEASTNKFGTPYSASVNATGLVIDNMHSPSDLKGPALGFSATVVGRTGVGANFVYAQNIPQGQTVYGFGPSFGLPGASIDIPQASTTTPPWHIANLYGL